MKKFKHEEKFLDFIVEEKQQLYSIVELSDRHSLTPHILLEKPKFSTYLLDTIQYSDGVSYLDSIFLFDNDIYIYLSINDSNLSSFSCRIYYPIGKKKDVDFFVLNLKKINKNGN
jgi:hypothetical protein